MGKVNMLFREEIEESEMAAHDLLRDAKYLACAPKAVIWHNWEWIEEARELLNDALAKAGTERDAA